MKTSRIVLLNMLTLALLALYGTALADETTKEGYLTDSRGDLVKSGTGLCWHTGFWTPAMAIAECDPVAARPQIAQTATPTSAPVAVPRGVSFVPYTMEVEALFAYNKSVLTDSGKKKISDEILNTIKQTPQEEVILVTGHADRIGSDEYNLSLSQRRADAARTFLVEQGVDARRIETKAMGESEPVVSCDNVKGRANRNNRALIDCLQPNRRIVMEVKGQKPVQQ